MRGHAKIELTNIKTGETEVVEHSNMFTNALQEIMKPVGKMLFTTMYETTAHYCKYLTGLVCFGEPIEENPEIILPPVGNDIVACGTNYAYTGRNTMCGSFNVVDSTKENDKDLNPDADIKLVWEFAGNQGNGTISCLSLTSQMAPMYSMFGSKAPNPDVRTSKPSNVTSYEKGYSISGQDYIAAIYSSRDRLLYADYQSNTVYFSSGENFDLDAPDNIKASGKIKLRRFKTSLSSVLLRDPARGGFTSEDKTSDYIYVDVPEEILNTITEKCIYICGGIYSDEGYIYCYIKPCVTNGKDYVEIEVDEILNILKISVSNWSTQVIKVKNTTGTKCRVYSLEPNYNYAMFNYPRSNTMAITNNYLLLCNSDTTGIFLINLSNNADVTKLKNPEETGDLKGLVKGNFVSENKIYFSVQSGGNFVVLDPKTKKTYYTEFSTGNAGSSSCLHSVYGSPLLYIAGDVSSNSILYYQLTKLPFYIATINNLDVPVVKTPAQTMKITYTLTSKAEELPEQE